MPFMVEINVRDQETIDAYAKVVFHSTEKPVKDVRTSTTIKSDLNNSIINLENVFSSKVFRGSKIGSESGKVSHPDWLVTASGVKSLVNYTTYDTAKITQSFYTIINKEFEDAVAIEGKLLQTTDIKNVDIGDLTLLGKGKQSKELTEHQIKDYNYGSPESPSKQILNEDHSGLINVTRYSMINELRNSYTSDTDFKSKGIRVPKLDANTLQTPPDMQKWINKIRSQFPKDSSIGINDIVKDHSVIQIRKELDKLYPKKSNKKKSDSKETEEKVGIPDRAIIENAVNSINIRLVKNGFLKEINLLSNSGNLFKHILNTPNLKNQFYQKSKNMAIIRMINGKVKALVLTVAPNEFNEKYFGAKWEYNKEEDAGKISVFLKSSVEEEFRNNLAKEATRVSYRNEKQFNKTIAQLIRGRMVQTSESGISFFSKEKITTQHTNSIPMSTAKINMSIVKNVDKLKSSSNRAGRFIQTGHEPLPEFKKQSRQNMGSFLSSEYLKLLVIKKVVETMPHGPVGGAPKSDKMLTYRTGRFANSIALMVDYKRSLVKYYYNPIYYVHERTSRNPKSLIENSINAVMVSRFKQVFNISEVSGF